MATPESLGPLPYQSWGSGAPILFLHGFMGDARDWADVAAELSGCRSIAVDLPGHGRARDLCSADMSLHRAAACAWETVDALGLDAVRICGYSMGGRVAMCMLEQAPERCEGLLLESAHPGFVDDRTRRERLARDQATADELRNGDFSAFLKTWFEMPMFSDLATDPARLASIVARRLEQDPGRLADAMLAFSVATQPDYRALLAERPQKLVLVTGERDEKYAATYRSLMRVLGGSAHLELVAGAGHNVHVANVARFAAFLRNPA